MKSVDVLVGQTWPVGMPCSEHYRLYGTRRVSASDREKTMVFDGMDGVVINDAPSTNVSGCWADVESQPATIEYLVGPKGLAFLKLLVKNRKRTAYFTYGVGKNKRVSKRKRTTTIISELRVVSAWQFTVVGYESEKVIFRALKKHLKMTPRKQEWVLEKPFFS